MQDDRKVCFVIMGFGKKTDFESGRTLDLDATYEGIIKPSAEAAGLRCIRADEIIHSGVIDLPMYEMLFRADLVIADISTGNVNAVYELGVRHGLRPSATIIMKEDGGKLYFDLNHVNTFGYHHLGEDIGVKEARRASGGLKKLIETILKGGEPDSPVYTYLPRLQKPRFSDEEYEDILDEAENAQEHLSALLRRGEAEGRVGNHGLAASAYKSALDLKPDDSFLTQQYALHLYKSKHPSALAALHVGRAVIRSLDPEESNDPETLGIAGAIEKRLWLETKVPDHLEDAIRFYRRGFEVRRDYYNGENLATCLVMQAVNQQDVSEAEYDRKTAKKVRESLYEILLLVVASNTFEERSDKRWVYATLANVCYALQHQACAVTNERKFRDEHPANGSLLRMKKERGLCSPS